MGTVETGRPLAVVTGASSGIGYELAKQFAQHGYDLVIAADSERVNEAARTLERMGSRVEPLEVDLSTFDGVERLFRRVEAQGTPVEAVAINAGIGSSGDFARDTDLESELRLVRLNVAGKEKVYAASLRTKLMGAAAKVLPDPLKAELHKRMLRPGSAPRRAEGRSARP